MMVQKVKIASGSERVSSGVEVVVEQCADDNYHVHKDRQKDVNQYEEIHQKNSSDITGK